MRPSHFNAALQQSRVQADPVDISATPAGRPADWCTIPPAFAPKIGLAIGTPEFAPLRMSEDGLKAMLALARRMRDLASH